MRNSSTYFKQECNTSSYCIQNDLNSFHSCHPGFNINFVEPVVYTLYKLLDIIGDTLQCTAKETRSSARFFKEIAVP